MGLIWKRATKKNLLMGTNSLPTKLLFWLTITELNRSRNNIVIHTAC